MDHPDGIGVYQRVLRIKETSSWMEAFRRFRNEGHYLDAKLAPVGGHPDTVVLAHRVVLASRSPFLHKQFVYNRNPESVIPVCVQDLCLRQIVRLIYDGQVVLTSELEFENVCAALRAWQVELRPEPDAQASQGSNVGIQIVPPPPPRSPHQRLAHIPVQEIVALPPMSAYRPSTPKQPFLPPIPMLSRIQPMVKEEQAPSSTREGGKHVSSMRKNERYDPLKRYPNPPAVANIVPLQTVEDVKDEKPVTSINSRNQVAVPVAPPVPLVTATRQAAEVKTPSKGTDGLFWLQFFNDNGYTEETVFKHCKELDVNFQRASGLEIPNRTAFLAFATADEAQSLLMMEELSTEKDKLTSLRPVAGPHQDELCLQLKFANNDLGLVVSSDTVMKSFERNKIFGFGNPVVVTGGLVEIPFADEESAIRAKRRYEGQAICRNRIEQARVIYKKRKSSEF